MYKVIEFSYEKKQEEDFLKLPGLLYGKDVIMQNVEEEKAILHQTHILSKYFEIYKYLVYRKKKVVARTILTIYPNDETLYFGYFECVEDEEAVKTLFHEVRRFANQKGMKRIYGPVDCSFWIKYRLKTNYFNEPPYVGEPYNKSYYLGLLLNCGFSISERYVSNYFKKFPFFNKGFSKQKDKYKNRYKEFCDKGYDIISPNKQEFEQSIKEIYGMIMELYVDFPAFKHIDEEDYKRCFEGFRHIMDYSMVKIAYYKGKAVGFLIGLPDYGNLLLRKPNLSTNLKTYLNRMRSSNYVMLYMGARKGHQGLGKAMTRSILTNAIVRRSTLMTALTKDGRYTKVYGKPYVDKVYEYVLLELELDSGIK